MAPVAPVSAAPQTSTRRSGFKRFLAGLFVCLHVAHDIAEDIRTAPPGKDVADTVITSILENADETVGAADQLVTGLNDIVGADPIDTTAGAGTKC